MVINLLLQAFLLLCYYYELKNIISLPFINRGIDYAPKEWVDSQYDPLPTLVQAAKRIYKKEPLPYIRRANSAGIPKAVEILKQISNEAKSKTEKILVLVTGVPSAGKTLLGLQFVHECL